ncbi:MAG: hypothetical protein ABL958_10340, partial [Bdellovibrionia bacterium]
MYTRILSVTTFAFLAFSQNILAQPAPVLMPMPIQTAHIPNGFDSNDKVQVVIESYLPNPCYKVGPSKVKIDGPGRVVTIEQWVYRYPEMICPQVIVPFAAVIDVGILTNDSYQVRDGASDRVLGGIAIRKASNLGPDDYFYAPVADARIDQPKKEIILEGVFTNECLACSEIKVYQD